MPERCPSCGSPPHLPHLRNCKIHGKENIHISNKNVARSQMDLALILINELGYDPEDYDFKEMTREECSKLINALLRERG